MVVPAPRMSFKSSAEGEALPPKTASKYAATTFISAQRKEHNQYTQSRIFMLTYREREGGEGEERESTWEIWIGEIEIRRESREEEETAL